MSEEQENPSILSALRRKDLLGTTEFKQTHLFASFAGIRKVFKRFFKLSELPFVHSNDVKVLQRGKFEPSYPYAYVSITSMGISENNVDVARIRRHGGGHTVHQANSTLTKHYFFPITLKVELHFITDDFLKAIQFMSEALILSQTKVLTFTLRTGDVEGFVTITPESKDLQLPRADKENEVDPESFDIVCNFSIDTWTGVSRETAKVNNNGEVELNVSIATDADTLQIIDTETSHIKTADVHEK
jgi:hypothetical protein